MTYIVLIHITLKMIFTKVVHRPVGKLEQLRFDKKSLDILYIKVSEAKLQINYSKLFLKFLQKSAAETIEELKKEYNLH